MENKDNSLENEKERIEKALETIEKAIVDTYHIPTGISPKQYDKQLSNFKRKKILDKWPPPAWWIKACRKNPSKTEDEI